jgi:hypothetical protein
MFLIQVSIATFKLSRVEAIYQALGFNSCLRAQCSGVSAEECGSIPWDEFQVSSHFLLIILIVIYFLDRVNFRRARMAGAKRKT